MPYRRPISSVVGLHDDRTTACTLPHARPQDTCACVTSSRFVCVCVCLCARVYVRLNSRDAIKRIPNVQLYTTLWRRCRSHRMQHTQIYIYTNTERTRTLLHRVIITRKPVFVVCWSRYEDADGKTRTSSEHWGWLWALRGKWFRLHSPTSFLSLLVASDALQNYRTVRDLRVICYAFETEWWSGNDDYFVFCRGWANKSSLGDERRNERRILWRRWWAVRQTDHVFMRDGYNTA